MRSWHLIISIFIVFLLAQNPVALKAKTIDPIPFSDTIEFINRYKPRIYDNDLLRQHRDSVYMIHLQLIPILKDIGRYKDAVHLMDELLRLYIEDGEYQSAKSLVDEISWISDSTSDSFIDMIAAFCYSYYYKGTSQFDSSLVYKNLAYDLALERKDTFHLVLLIEQIVDLALHEELVVEDVLEKIEKAILWTPGIWDEKHRILGLILMRGKYYLDHKEFDQAIEDLEYALHIYKELETEDGIDRFSSQYCLSLLADAYYGIEQYKKAFNFMKLSAQLREELFSLEKVEKAQRLLKELEFEKQQRKLDRVEAEHQLAIMRKDQQEMTFLVSGLVLVLITFSLLITIFQIIKRRKSDHKLFQVQRDLQLQKAHFYTNITHEFRTPLTVILGMVQKINNIEIRNLINRNAQNLLDLVNQLLDISKADANLLQLDMIQSDMVDYLNYLTESFYSKAENQKIRLICTSDLPELIMDFDQEKIKQIHFNLVSNALKYTSSGGKIVICLNQDENHLVWQVKDSGCGISAEQLEKIFERFYQAPDEPMNKVQGSGIGLSYAKELIELMNGKIEIKSEKGIGTTLKITLPISNKAPIQTIANANPGKALINSPSEFVETNNNRKLGDPPLVLVVEDNKDVGRYIVTCLSPRYRCELAVNGAQGLKLSKSLVPDIIVSDVMMPSMDGYQLVAQLKKDIRTSHIPVMLLTAKSSDSERIFGFKNGADAYLIKPFREEELLTRIENILKAKESLKARILGSLNQSENKLDNPFLANLNELLDVYSSQSNFSINLLCKKVGLSRMQLHRKLKSLVNMSTAHYIREYKLSKAVELLRFEDMNISEVCYACGFSDPSHFSKIFKERFGVSPSSYHAQQIVVS